ncbi:hypothetical protein [Pyxidicoccus xibeiensis]|uniref:hypothetical protein n=1 Tax=Pyxidicoccus xibeiensis TaxID=2906759 RepID=UPI0020A755C9|nr:hypothetical protein [Pyxidicoccus xibeiensis]MCP3140478.1 hypothetical protein [Pyxidicoccus xibeiensis]
MRRRLLIVLLALGTFGGYASGFASLARHHRHRCHSSGGWGERWDSHSRWDSRGPRESWEPRESRGYMTPAVEVPAPPAASPSPAEGPR